LYDYIYIPWCHLLFTRSQLRAAVMDAVASRRDEFPGDDPARKADRVMENFDRDLNRLSVRRFFTMVKDHPSLAITYKEFQPPKYSFLRALNRVPLVRELFTGSLICRLQKRG
jgi:hypothetical protein